MAYDVYMYAASLYCEACGEALIAAMTEELTKEGKEIPDMEDEGSYDSDEFPKGPFEAGESDTPTHCENCSEFMENALTDEGMIYVREAVADAYEKRPSNAQFDTSYVEESVALKDWAPFYDIDPPWSAKDYVEIKLDNMDRPDLEIMAEISHPHAEDWAEYHGSMEGGTWESADSEGTFVYDIWQWRPGLADELIKEGYNLDLSEYNEPDEEEIEATKKKWEEENEK